MVGAAEHQNLHELLEDHPVGDARPVAAWRTIHLRFWQQDGELLPDRLLLDVWWERGHGISPSSGSLVTPQTIERPAPAFQVDVLRPYPRSLLYSIFSQEKLGKSKIITKDQHRRERIQEMAGTSDWRSLVHSSEALLVLGSLHATPQDRKLERSKVRSVQVISDGEVYPASSFNSWGERGVISLARHAKQPWIMYVATENKVLKVDLLKQNVVDLGIPNLLDVHELTMVGDTLWIANTQRDEIVAFDVVRERVAKRVSLSVYDSAPKAISHMYEDDDEGPQLAVDEREVLDEFHCNQVFQGFDGELYVLVHYAQGNLQLIRRAARRLTKRQVRPGGVINLTTSRVIPLGLKGPHTLRKVRGDYWVCDSARSKINVYGPNWVLKETISSRGWVRGADISEQLDLYYIGVSQFRRRYLILNPTVQQIPNMVRAISVETKASMGELLLSNVEQVTNVYVVPIEIALAMLELQEDHAIHGRTF